MTLPAIIRAKLARDFRRMTQLTESELTIELVRQGRTRVWIALNGYHAGAGFRVAVLREGADGRIRRHATLKILIEEPGRARSVERDPRHIDLSHCYLALTGSHVAGLGFELLPSSWFEALYRDRAALRFLRQQLIALLKGVASRRDQL